MTEGPTAAQAALQRMQRDAPPLYPAGPDGADRVASLVQSLHPWPLPIMAMIGGGRVAYGEVGEPRPDVCTRQVAEGQFVVTMTSGWLDFLEAVSRAMAGASILHRDDGTAENARVLELPRIAELVAETLRHWRRFCQPRLWDLFWRERRIEMAPLATTDRVSELAEVKVTCAAAYMVAHEFGHVALDAGLTTSTEPTDEQRADAIGMEMYLAHADRRVGLRLALDGAAFAIRVTGSLARLGVRFAHDYGTPAERLATALAKARAMSPSAQFFDEACTVAAAGLEFMDDIDARIGGIAEPAGTGDAWATRANLIGALQSTVTAATPATTFVELFARSVGDLDVAAARDLARTLAAYYPAEPGPDGYLSRDIRARMGQSLAGCIGGMAAAEQALFAAA